MFNNAETLVAENFVYNSQMVAEMVYNSQLVAEMVYNSVILAGFLFLGRNLMSRDRSGIVNGMWTIPISCASQRSSNR
jgi:hypothetical protein